MIKLVLLKLPEDFSSFEDREPVKIGTQRKQKKLDRFKNISFRDYDLMSNCYNF